MSWKVELPCQSYIGSNCVNRAVEIVLLVAEVWKVNAGDGTEELIHVE